MAISRNMRFHGMLKVFNWYQMEFNRLYRSLCRVSESLPSWRVALGHRLDAGFETPKRSTLEMSHVEPMRKEMKKCEPVKRTGFWPLAAACNTFLPKDAKGCIRKISVKLKRRTCCVLRPASQRFLLFGAAVSTASPNPEESKLCRDGSVKFGIVWN